MLQAIFAPKAPGTKIKLNVAVGPAHHVILYPQVQLQLIGHPVNEDVNTLKGIYYLTSQLFYITS